MKEYGKLVALVCLLFLWNVGCTTNRPLYGGANKPELLRSKKALASYNYKDSTAANYYLKLYNAAGTETEQESIRNQILSDLMTMIDSNYHQFEDNLRSDKSTQELGADIATLGLTAAATVTGAAETKTILSAIATGVVGVNSSIDKEIFQNNTVQAIQLQMRAARSAVETKLINGMKQLIKDYPLQYGIRDIISYYYAGSLNDALIGLVQNSSNVAQTNQNAANTARTQVPGAVSAANTIISANPLTISISGINVSTITVQAKDANNNKETVSSGLVVLAASPGGTLSAVTDKGDGSYSATLTGTTAGVVHVTGTIGSTAIGVPVDVTVTH